MEHIRTIRYTPTHLVGGTLNYRNTGIVTCAIVDGMHLEHKTVNLLTYTEVYKITTKNVVFKSRT